MEKQSLKVAGNELRNTALSSDNKSAQNKSTENTLSNSSTEFSGGELGQLQEILFGQQQRSNAEQLNALQQQFADQIATLSQTMTDRLESLSRSIETSTATFEKKLEDLEAKQDAAIEGVSTKAYTQHTELKSHLEELNKSAADGAKQLEAELANQKQVLSTQMLSIETKLHKEMSTSVNNLQSMKLDKQNLASLLNDLSGKLTGSTAA